LHWHFLHFLYLTVDKGFWALFRIGLHWPDLPRGRRGTSEVIATPFLIPENYVNYWIDRVKSKQIEFRGPNRRFYNEQATVGCPFNEDGNDECLDLQKSYRVFND
jgi:hypothetical protein